MGSYVKRFRKSILRCRLFKTRNTATRGTLDDVTTKGRLRKYTADVIVIHSRTRFDVFTPVPNIAVADCGPDTRASLRRTAAVQTMLPRVISAFNYRPHWVCHGRRMQIRHHAPNHCGSCLYLVRYYSLRSDVRRVREFGS